MPEKMVHHPYHPTDLKIPGYVPNDKGPLELLGVFFGVLVVALVFLWWVMSAKTHLNNRTTTKLKITWFFMCGLIHLILEGYFSIYHETLAGKQTYLAQMWKEYGKGDSRYVSSDTFTVCMETITAFVDGPLAFMATYGFLYNTSYRHLAQLLLSLCQLYGDVLYFSTEVKDGFQHGEMYHPLHFWFYFFFMNILWIIIPFCCIVDSCTALASAQRHTDLKQGHITQHSKRK